MHGAQTEIQITLKRTIELGRFGKQNLFGRRHTLQFIYEFIFSEQNLKSQNPEIRPEQQRSGWERIEVSGYVMALPKRSETKRKLQADKGKALIESFFSKICVLYDLFGLNELFVAFQTHQNQKVQKVRSRKASLILTTLRYARYNQFLLGCFC